ncbi:type II toxin-antitoxin system RelE family toxin [Campylobacter ureolyticus]|uniref:type II toxin-antitoxin system RelE family toxin n=1 Tax=Campylobacter ureolyticus TaxID=827 RepID=UPI0022B508EA|nr:hypothetical protein [Campylobacter ureolyticus]MCZ6168367.1 hypothetical protein [Campylobacter ureolyticus]
MVAKMYEIIIPNKVDKMIKSIQKGDRQNAIRILFAIENLRNSNDPFSLKNCKKLENFENIYRWKVGQDYRIIGKKIKEVLVLELIKVSKREDAYKK